MNHGHTKNGISPTYQSWKSMKQRCLNPKRPQYPYYGGRGITFCEEWNNFEKFLEDMGIRPEGTTLDRIDCNKNYCKENCRWATSEEQSMNKNSSVWIMRKGKLISVSDFSKENQVNANKVYKRLRDGKTLDDIEIDCVPWKQESTCKD